jgi:hypothetical protein
MKPATVRTAGEVGAESFGAAGRFPLRNGTKRAVHERAARAVRQRAPARRLPALRAVVVHASHEFNASMPFAAPGRVPVRRFQWWLGPAGPTGRRSGIAGTAPLVALHAVSVFVFRRGC